MERLTASFASTGRRHGAALRTLGRIGGLLAMAGALAVAVVLAVFFAATAMVIGLLATALLAVAGLVFRSRQPVRARTEPGVIEARRVGGHQWVAYGWDDARR